MGGDGASVRDDGGDGRYATRTLLDPGTLKDLEDANTAFLVMLAARARRAPGRAEYGLPANALATLANLNAAALATVAGCHYALFDVEFADAAYWASLTRNAAVAEAVPETAATSFARTALFLAWHLVQADEFAAALVLGMTPAVQSAWRRWPLSGIAQAAPAAADAVRARWGAHRLFWPTLLETAAAGNTTGVLEIRRLGLQLLAMDGLRREWLPASGRAAPRTPPRAPARR